MQNYNRRTCDVIYFSRRDATYEYNNTGKSSWKYKLEFHTSFESLLSKLLLDAVVSQRLSFYTRYILYRSYIFNNNNNKSGQSSRHHRIVCTIEEDYNPVAIQHLDFSEAVTKV